MGTIYEELVEKGRAEGLQQGAIKTLRGTILDVLQLRFEIVPAFLTQSINQITDTLFLNVLHKQAVIIDSIDEFIQLLNPDKE